MKVLLTAVPHAMARSRFKHESSLAPRARAGLTDHLAYTTNKVSNMDIEQLVHSVFPSKDEMFGRFVRAVKVFKHG